MAIHRRAVDPVEVVGDAEAGTTRMTWPGWGPDRTVLVHVDHGEVVELRIDGAPVVESTVEVAVEVSAGASVTDQAKRYAVEKVRHVAARVTAPVLFVRVKLHHLGDPAAQRPAQAEALLDVNGRAVRAHAAEATMTEAIDELVDRLWQRISDNRTGPEPRGSCRRRASGAVGTDPHPPVAWFERPPEQRQLVRHKTVADEPMSIEEAVFDMDLLDYDFYLFNDLASGQDAVVRRAADDGRAVRAAPRRIEPPVSTTARHPLVRGAGDAQHPAGPGVARGHRGADGVLRRSRERAGSVLYRRYDGHYGLVTPAC